MTTERRAYRVTGRVQGVGFRWWARDLATRFGLRGWVRNDRDGSVRLEAEGEGTVLDRFEAALRAGPPAARVGDIQRDEPGSESLPAGFHITR
jgi:acylphosphatase